MIRQWKILLRRFIGSKKMVESRSFGQIAYYKFLKYWEVAKINYLTRTTYIVNTISRSAAVALRIWIFAY